MFGCILNCFVTARSSIQNGLSWCNKCKSSCREVAAGFFTKNAPDPPHWTLNSCFGVFRSVWVHFLLFCYCVKLDTKSAEMVDLMHKFVAWSRIGIFLNERTRSTQLDPKLLFLCVSKCLRAFGNVSLLHETWCRIGWTDAINAQVCAIKSHRNFSQRTHPIHPVGP